MLFLNKPSEKTIRQFLDRQRSLTLSYPDVGLTKEAICPPGYGVDRVRAEIGIGARTFTQASSAFKKWQQFEISWVEVYPQNPLISPGTVLAVLAWHGCVWSLNACRIVYVIEQEGAISRYGFGYGTLPDHAETGEERFMLEWDKTTDKVFYDIFAFSNPNHLWGWLAYPIVRYIQNRFRRDSILIMKNRANSWNQLK